LTRSIRRLSSRRWSQRSPRSTHIAARDYALNLEPRLPTLPPKSVYLAEYPLRPTKPSPRCKQEGALAMIGSAPNGPSSTSATRTPAAHVRRALGPEPGPVGALIQLRRAPLNTRGAGSIDYVHIHPSETTSGERMRAPPGRSPPNSFLARRTQALPQGELAVIA